MPASDLLVCSNRGPFTYEGPVTEPVGRRGGGGLIGSLIPVMSGSGGTWIAAALSGTDREIARAHPSGREQDGFNLRFIDVPPDLQKLHYDVMSNEVLWFLFHYLFDMPHLPTFDGLFERAWDAYRHVNEIFADAVADSPSRAVMFEDYHLMLAAQSLRRTGRTRRPLLYFHHTPWCDPDYFSVLPEAVGIEILEGMLAHDVVGFHAHRWADAFVRCCERFVRGAVAGNGQVRWNRRTIRVVVAPVPIDAKRLDAEAHDESTDSWVDSHDEMRAGRKLLLRVDRIDLSKNPLRGFLAFELLLQRRPKLANEVIFLALLYPSRTTVERYHNYFSDCLGVVRRVNERYESKVTADVGPIHLIFEDDFSRSLGALRLYDALLVNPVFDGLNLVCKEGALVNERAGSVILSRNAGAFEELEPAVLALNPFDVPATADAIETALEETGAGREKRARKLKRLATRSTPDQWLHAQLSAAGL